MRRSNKWAYALFVAALGLTTVVWAQEADPAKALQNLSLQIQQKIAAENPQVYTYPNYHSTYDNGPHINGNPGIPEGCINANHATCNDLKKYHLRINKIYKQMWAQERLLNLTPEIRKKYKIDELGCNRSGHCSNLLAFYLPLTHQIFIDPSIRNQAASDHLQPTTKESGVVIHELTHAYQYAYRFPIDLSLLSKKVDEHQIAPSDLRDYLDFFYEGQANYKVRNLDEFYFSNGTGGAWHWIEYETSKYYIGGNLSTHWDNQSNELLAPFERPWISGFSIFYTCSPLPELVVAKEDHTANNIRCWNFKFHYLFAKAIEKTYFGELPFLFQQNHDDLKTYNELYQQAYKRLTEMNVVEKDPRCESLIDKVINSSSSPLVQWLTLPINEIEACPAYKGLNFDRYRKNYINLLLKNSDTNSPFSTMRPGGEGSHPGTDVNPEPSFEILPQLEVSPDILNDKSESAPGKDGS